MARRDIPLLRQILERTLTRYLTVRPDGVVPEKGVGPRARVEVRIVGYGGARTLYKSRKPDCRSLDGVRSHSDSARACASCPDQPRCTPQVRVDLFLDGHPFRLLLAYTSARNFLTYVAALQKRGIALEDTMHRIDVIAGGAWGEVRFTTLTPSSQDP